MIQGQKRKPRAFLATNEGRNRLEDKKREKGYTYESLAEAASVNDDQVKRLFNPHWEYRVQRDAIEKIAKVLDLHPTDIVNSHEWYWCPKTGREVQVAGRLVIDEEDLNSIPLEVIVELLKKIPKNISFRVDKIDKGSVIIFFETTLQGFEQMQNMFRTGELAKLLSVPIMDVQLDYVIEPTESVNLRQWLENNFVEALQANWLDVPEVFRNRTLNPAFRSGSVKRAKQIQLGARTIDSILQLIPLENDEIRINLGIYPSENQTFLPENLKLTIFFESQEPEEIPIGNNSLGFLQSLVVATGEIFSIQLSVSDISYTEYFAVGMN